VPRGMLILQVTGLSHSPRGQVAKNLSVLSTSAPAPSSGVDRQVSRRGTCDRGIWTKALAFAADAGELMGFACRFRSGVRITRFFGHFSVTCEQKICSHDTRAPTGDCFDKRDTCTHSQQDVAMVISRYGLIRQLSALTVVTQAQRL